jgi:hypothetical protein
MEQKDLDRVRERYLHMARTARQRGGDSAGRRPEDEDAGGEPGAPR